ncbi:hypothetical protein SESBI_47456 [Sesbania bispinosa]|nr:hypothetical protein SESBI_47456 [Sesbania bispinosa]
MPSRSASSSSFSRRKKKCSCDFFEWADDEVAQQPGNFEAVEACKEENVELRKKISKLQRKLTEERKEKIG